MAQTMDNFGYSMALPDDPALFGYLLDPLTDSSYAEYLPVDDFFDECAPFFQVCQPVIFEGAARCALRFMQAFISDTASDFELMRDYEVPVARAGCTILHRYTVMYRDWRKCTCNMLSSKEHSASC